MENKSAKNFWRKADSLRVGRMLLIGLAAGVMVRWLSISAPPLPVLASEKDTPDTNAPVAIKIEGASPSVRD